MLEKLRPYMEQICVYCASKGTILKFAYKQGYYKHRRSNHPETINSGQQLKMVLTSNLALLKEVKEIKDKMNNHLSTVPVADQTSSEDHILLKVPEPDGLLSVLDKLYAKPVISEIDMLKKRLSDAEKKLASVKAEAEKLKAQNTQIVKAVRHKVTMQAKLAQSLVKHNRDILSLPVINDS